MIERLLVVATHNGDERVERIVASTDTPILVVDTGSTKTNASIRARALDQPHVVGWLQTPYQGFDTGAYLWAYFNVEAKYYMFMQDSCLPRDRNFTDAFHAMMPRETKDGAVAWNLFSMSIWDSQAQRATADYMYGGGSWPEHGIFGPIFYTSRASLDRLVQKRLLPPYPMHKEMAQMMERVWALAFWRAGMPVRGITSSFEPDRAGMERAALPLLTKTFGGRT